MTGPALTAGTLASVSAVSTAWAGTATIPTYGSVAGGRAIAGIEPAGGSYPLIADQITANNPQKISHLRNAATGWLPLGRLQEVLVGDLGMGPARWPAGVGMVGLVGSIPETSLLQKKTDSTLQQREVTPLSPPFPPCHPCETAANYATPLRVACSPARTARLAPGLGRGRPGRRVVGGQVGGLEAWSHR